MLDPQTMLQQSHREDLMKSAEQSRLAAQATADEPHLPDRVVLTTSAALIDVGLRMQAWYQIRRLRRDWARLHPAP
jgi:hypothetical protein